MNSQDLLDFASRNCTAVTASKAEHWARRRKEHGSAEPVRAAAALRRQIVAMGPGWPTEEDRSEDLATHARVTACLSLVPSARAR